MKIPLVATGIFLIGASPLCAATAAFLPDGKRAVRADDEGIVVMDLETAVEKPLSLPEDLKVAYPALAVTKDLLLVGAEDRVMAWNPAKAEWALFCTLPEKRMVEDLAVDPKTGLVLVADRGPAEGEGAPAWWVWSEAKRALVKVKNRRARSPRWPVFDAAGTLYFSGDGDVWKGEISPDDSDGFVLTGNRIWPIAEKETSEGNSSGVSAHDILPLKKYLVVDRSRTGGSGWGSLLRMANEDAYEKHLALRWEELAETGSGVNLALSPDGTRALAYVRSQHRWSIVDVDTGRLKPLVKAEEKSSRKSKRTQRIEE